MRALEHCENRSKITTSFRWACCFDPPGWLDKLGVTGSNPVSPTIPSPWCGGVWGRASAYRVPGKHGHPLVAYQSQACGWRSRPSRPRSSDG